MSLADSIADSDFVSGVSSEGVELRECMHERKKNERETH